MLSVAEQDRSPSNATPAKPQAHLMALAERAMEAGKSTTPHPTVSDAKEAAGFPLPANGVTAKGDLWFNATAAADQGHTAGPNALNSPLTTMNGPKKTLVTTARSSLSCQQRHSLTVA